MTQPAGKNCTTEYEDGADVQRGNPPGETGMAVPDRQNLADNPPGEASLRKGLSNRTLAVILVAVVAMILVALIIVFQIFAGQKPQEEQTKEERTILYSGKEYRYDERRTNILFMGIDKDLPMDARRGTGSLGMADAILLVSLDSAENSMDIIAIPRETVTPVTVTDEDGNEAGEKDLVLTYQYAFGRTPEQSGELMVEAVSRLLYGIPIEKYCAVNFEAVPVLNDEAGGVDVEVLENMTGLHPSFVQGRTVHLDGNMAFDYVHYRDTNVHGSTLSRMDRQKQYILAYLQKLKSFADESVESLFNLYERLGANMDTNITTEDMVSFTDRFSQIAAEQMEVVRIPGDGMTGKAYMEEYGVDYDVKYDVYIADQKKLKELVIGIFYEEAKETGQEE